MPLNLGPRVDLPSSAGVNAPGVPDGTAAGSPLAGLRMQVRDAARPRSDALPPAPRPAALGQGLILERVDAAPARAGAFDRPVLLPSALEALPTHFWRGITFRVQVEQMAAKLARGGTLDDRDLNALRTSLHRAAADATGQARRGDVTKAYTLALSDSSAFESRLLDELRNSRAGRSNPAALERNFKQSQETVGRAWNQAMAGVLDRAGLPGDGGVPSTIVVANRTYARKESLGAGHFGAVYRYECVDEDKKGHSIALKTQTSLSALEMATAAQEGRALVAAMGMGGGADHIAPLVGAVRTPEALYLAVGLAEGGSLRDALPTLQNAAGQQPPALSDVDLTRFKILMMLDMATGLQRLQDAKGVVHADVAARNVLLTADGKAQLADFGLAREAEPGSTPTDARYPAAGSAIPTRWSPPETLRHEGRHTGSDTWGLGQTMVELITGLPALPANTPDHLSPADRIRSLPAGSQAELPGFDPAQTPGLPAAERDALYQLVRETLWTDPEARIRMSDLREGLLGILQRTRADPEGGPGIDALRQRVSAVLKAGRTAEGSHAPAAELSPSAPSMQVQTSAQATNLPSTGPSTQIPTGFYTTEGSAQPDRDPPGDLPSTAGSHRGGNDASEGDYEPAVNSLPPEPSVQARPGVGARGPGDDPNYEYETR